MTLQKMLVYQINAQMANGTPAYHLPRILEKMLQKHQRGTVLMPTLEKAQEVDQMLWTYTPISFLPHGCQGQDLHPQQHPIWVTSLLENVNGSEVLLLSQSYWPKAEDLPENLPFTTLLYLLNNPNHPDPHRMYARWSVPCTFWHQTPQGWQSQMPPWEGSSP